MNLSPDGGTTPAARREGDRSAQQAAYRSGMVLRGKVDIPVIDWRHYLEHRLDMHHAHQSFATRQRLLNYDGDASNQIIWFTDARPGTPQFDQTPQAFLVLDQWLANIKSNPEKSVAENKPAAAVDSCFAANGSLLARGEDVWSGILDDGPNGACADAFPLNSSSRIVSGGLDRGQCLPLPAAAGAVGPRPRALRRVAADGRRDRRAGGDLPPVFSRLALG